MKDKRIAYNLLLLPKLFDNLCEFLFKYYHFVVTLQHQKGKTEYKRNRIKQTDSIKMSSTIHFTKMQGAGNDYIYVNTLLYKVQDPETASRKLSDRHFGIGSDGLVLIGAPSDPKTADFSMRIFNADGSEAMMCGNASRCIGKYVYERGLFSGNVVRLETRSGIKLLKLHIINNVVESVTVDMGIPRFNVPSQYNGVEPKGWHGTFVSMGNPHYVIFVDDINNTDVAGVGSKLEYDKSFPERCNIEFAQKIVQTPEKGLAAQSFRTRVWERGSGITMACGTGACATAVAATSTGVAGRKSEIVMDGGTLTIEWDEKTNHVLMTGPAEFSFDGEIEL